MPWSMALRTRCSSGSLIASSTLRSTSSVGALDLKSTSLPQARAISRGHGRQRLQHASTRRHEAQGQQRCPAARPPAARRDGRGRGGLMRRRACAARPAASALRLAGGGPRRARGRVSARVASADLLEGQRGSSGCATAARPSRSGAGRARWAGPPRRRRRKAGRADGRRPRAGRRPRSRAHQLGGRRRRDRSLWQCALRPQSSLLHARQQGRGRSARPPLGHAQHRLERLAAPAPRRPGPPSGPRPSSVCTARNAVSTSSAMIRRRGPAPGPSAGGRWRAGAPRPRARKVARSGGAAPLHAVPWIGPGADFTASVAPSHAPSAAHAAGRPPLRTPWPSRAAGRAR